MAASLSQRHRSVGAWGPHHPSPKVLVFPGKIQVFSEVQAVEAVPVAADIFRENSWVSGSALLRHSKGAIIHRGFLKINSREEKRSEP